MLRLFKYIFGRKAKKCSCCKKREVRGYMFGKPLCLNCILEARYYSNLLIEAIKEENWQQDDRREIAEIEKRYTKGIAVKGSD